MHDPKPYCPGCDQQFHDHPAKAVANLGDVHRLGECGLNGLFPADSRWNYGPIYENLETVVKVRAVRGGAAFASGVNYSQRPNDEHAAGKPCWFIKCEIVSSPFGRKRGEHIDLPPAALVPHAVVLAERRCWALAASAAKPAPDLRDAQIEKLTGELEDTKDRLAAHKKALSESRDSLDRVRDSLRDQRTRADNAVTRYRDLQASMRALASRG